jgi:chitodextrinase
MSANSNTVTTTTLATSTDTSAPSAPSNLVATAVSSARINLTWSASTDNVAVTGYAIYRDSNKIADTSATSFSDLGLSASTTYAYTVKAYDAAGNTSASSNIASATTLKGSTDTSAPNAPRKLKAHVVSYTHVNLKWKAPENKKGIKGYAIFRNGLKIATVKRNHYNDIRLSPATTYSYTVKAYDKAGNMSADSNTISVTTLTRKVDNDHDDDDDHDKLNDRKGGSSSKIEKVKNIISEKLEKIKNKEQNKKSSKK